MTDAMNDKLSKVRDVVDGADAAVHCTPEGFILATAGEPDVDESLLGDVIAAATRMAASAGELLRGDGVTAVLVSSRSAIAARRCADGNWVGLLLSEPGSLGLALEALEAIE